MTVGDAPFSITRPPAGAPATPLVFASPHSGDRYPADMEAAPGLPRHSLRSAEDALVGRLVEDGPAHGAPLIEGRVGRGSPATGRRSTRVGCRWRRRRRACGRFTRRTTPPFRI